MKTFAISLAAILVALPALAETGHGPDPKAARCVQEASKTIPGNDTIAKSKRESYVKACMARA